MWGIQTPPGIILIIARSALSGFVGPARKCVEKLVGDFIFGGEQLEDPRGVVSIFSYIERIWRERKV